MDASLKILPVTFCMKILHLDTGRGWRGGQQQVLWLMEELRQRGHEQLLATPAGSLLGEAMRRRGFTVADLDSSVRSLASVKMLRRIAPGFDILHAHDAHAHSLAWLSGAVRRRRSWPKLVVSRRVAFPVARFGGLKYAAADAYIAISDYVRQQLLNANVPAKKIHVVFDGVKLPSPPAAEARRQFRSRFGLSERSPVIGTFTSLAPEKLLREQVELLEALRPSAHLWIGRPAADPGQYEAETALLDYARQRHVQQRFRILPLADDLPGFLGALDVFLYLTKLEGLGSAILLAMAHGLPVIASRVGGIPEIIRHKETGLLVGDNMDRDEIKKELIAAVSLLLDSEPLRAELGSAARRFVVENATTNLMAQKTMEIYEQILKTSEGAPSGRQRGIAGGRV